MTVEIITSTQSWTCPTGVTSVFVECQGGGGGSGGSSAANQHSAGGTSGMYCASTISVTAGNSYTVTVGAAGIAGPSGGFSGGTGGDSWFQNISTVLAKGGGGSTGGVAQTSGSTAPAAVNVSLGVGTTKFAGAQGGAASPSSGGGGGAGGASSGGAGLAGGSSASGGAGGSARANYGGAGGHGSTTNTNGGNTTPGDYGAGAGGIWTNAIGAGRVGAKGVVVLTYTAADSAAPSQPGQPTLSNKLDVSVTLSWPTSTDDVAVTNYKIYKDGVLYATLGNVLTGDVTGLTRDTSYSFTVTALDAASNESTPSLARVYVTPIYTGMGLL